MKRFAMFLGIVLSLCFLASCGMQEPADEGNPSPPAHSEEETGGAAEDTESVSFSRSYSVPEDWFASPELSSESKLFFLKEGTTLDAPTSNISVEFEENRYAESEHEIFREAILRQLLAQAQEGYTVSGSGYHSENGLIVYAFTIENPEDASAITTKQYYIIGDYEYAFVHATDFHDETIPDVDAAAQMMVDSFRW